MTDKEKSESEQPVIDDILLHLAKAWNIFLKLDRQHPTELQDFADGLHKCQSVIGMRVARDFRPDLFPKKREGGR